MPPRIGWILLDFGFAKLVLRSPRARGFRACDNPGCYSSAAIALGPLTAAGLIAGDAPISINAVSGYSGGGKADPRIRRGS